jgi:hypothetical protein
VRGVGHGVAPFGLPLRAARPKTSGEAPKARGCILGETSAGRRPSSPAGVPQAEGLPLTRRAAQAEAESPAARRARGKRSPGRTG